MPDLHWWDGVEGGLAACDMRQKPRIVVCSRYGVMLAIVEQKVTKTEAHKQSNNENHNKFEKNEEERIATGSMLGGADG